MLRRTLSLPYLPLLIAPIVMLAPALLPGRALFWGTPFMQFMPWRAFAWEMLQDGSLPLWNPWVGMGAPLIANYQSALFYPPNWLYFMLAGLGGLELMAWGQGWLVTAHLAWASLGMAFLVRRLGMGRLAQTISGLAFGLSGYLVARAGFLSINATVAWLPWIILGVTDLALLPASSEQKIQGIGEKGDRETSPNPFSLIPLFPARFVFLSVCIGLMFLAGHAQTAWYTLLLAGIWGVFLAYFTSRSDPAAPRFGFQPEGWKAAWSSLIRTWGRLGLAAGLGGLLAAVQLLPTAEYLLQSQRSAAVNYEAAMTYSFWPWRLLGLLAPGLFGSPASGDYWGYGNYWEDAVYIGLVPLLLATGVLVYRVKSRQIPEVAGSGGRRGFRNLAIHPALVYFLAGLALAAFILAMGKNTPVFPWLFRHAPGFDMFQAPSRFSLWAVFALSLLAGSGMQAWRRPTGRGLYWTRLGAAAAAGVCLAAGAASFFSQAGQLPIEPASIRAAAMAGFWGLCAGILALATPEAVGHRYDLSGQGWWAWAVVLSVGVDLIVAGWGLNPAIDAGVYRPAPAHLTLPGSLAGEGRMYLAPDDEEQVKFEQYFRFDTFYPEGGWSRLPSVFLPNTNIFSWVPTANNFDPLVPGRYARWMETLGTADREIRLRLLNLMSVNAVEIVDVSQPEGVRFEQSPGLPRLRWVPCGLAAKDAEDALDRVLRGAFEPQAQVLLEPGSTKHIPVCGDREGGKEENLYNLNESANRLVARVNAPAPGYLVVSDTWYPGWRAWIDGRPVEILRANYLFRAIHVPAGEHVVTMAFRPSWFYLGASLSALSWTAIAVFLYRQSRASQTARYQQSSFS